MTRPVGWRRICLTQHIMTRLDPFLEGLPSLGGLIVIGCVTIVGGLMRGFTGFGAAMIIIPVTALVTLPRDAVIYHAMIEIPTALQLLPDGLRNARRSTVLPMIFGLVAAVPVGMLLLTQLPSDMMRVTMSVAVLCLVAFMWVGGRLPPPRGMGAGFIGGIGGGVLQALSVSADRRSRRRLSHGAIHLRKHAGMSLS